MPKIPVDVASASSFAVNALPGITGLSRSGIYLAIKAGDLVARKYGRRTIVLRTDLESFLQNLETSR